MTEPTLQQVFGTNASQTSTTITITKADLTGLTASASNTAESLFVAIMLKAASYLTTANSDLNSDQSVSIEPSYVSLVTRLSNTYRQNTYSVNLQKLDTATAVDPDDY